MKNRIIILIFFMSLFLGARGQSTAENVVRSFGENMLSWTQTGKLMFRESLIELSDGKIKVRVYDELSSYLFAKHPEYQNANELNSYLNCLEKEMENGIAVRYSNFRQVPPEKLLLDESNKEDLITRGVKCIACDVNVTGTFNHSSEDLFYVYKEKISKIDKCETITDEKTGERKIRASLSDIDFEDETFGVTYNYSKSFPIGASLSYAIPGWVFGVDFGVTLNADEYISDDVEMTNIMSYKRTKTTVKPRFFMTGTVALNLKYVAIGCGVGFLYFSGEEEESSYVGSNSISVGTSTTQNTVKFKPMVRPTIRGFIPFNDELALSLSVDYNYVFGYKDLNGIGFGIGLQFTID